MVKKTLLKLEYKPEYRAFGVFSPQKDYRLCWLINRHLGMEFIRLNDMQHTPQSRQEPIDFPVFQYKGPDGYAHWLLIGNKTPKGPLFADPRNMDFLLLILGKSGTLDIKDTIQDMRSIAQVQAIYEINPIIGSQAGSFFFDLELFLDEQGN